MGKNFESKHPRSTDGKFAEKNRKEADLELTLSADDWDGGEVEQETETARDLKSHGVTRADLDEAEQVAKCEETLDMLERTYGLHPDVAVAFEEDGTLYYSERIGGMGVLCWISNKPEYKQAVKDFEKETGGKVYHCVLTHTEFGEMFDMMYVPKKESQKEGDFEALRDRGEAFVATLDEQMPSGYELGYAGYTGRGGGLVRKW
ncbi:MAG: hypothetical protein E6049_09470 [Varibaculum cambriense]|nr:hypothetical protein [Varibaculum cambriense]